MERKTTEYIDRQETIKAVIEVLPHEARAYAERAIQKVPAADVVKVVRCRDCKFSPIKIVYGCPMANLAFDGNRWCWRGEQDDNH